MEILNKYEGDGFLVIEYTVDGSTVSHTVKTPIQTEPIEPQEPQTTTEDKINFIYYKSMGVI